VEQAHRRVALDGAMELASQQPPSRGFRRLLDPPKQLVEFALEPLDPLVVVVEAVDLALPSIWLTGLARGAAAEQRAHDLVLVLSMVLEVRAELGPRCGERLYGFGVGEVDPPGLDVEGEHGVPQCLVDEMKKVESFHLNLRRVASLCDRRIVPSPVIPCR